MLPSPKVVKHLAAIRRDQLTKEELRELLQVIARDFDINIKIDGELGEEDFWSLSPEDESRFEDLLTRATGDIQQKRYTEYKMY
ncbi:hypothetical protein [Moorella sp. Hama-1]|uniref:hypothetical protein n=1 Tax=Moorella sp. Hama-1 TaxID=2138101 RepID=UPI000D64C0EA|nr:hypothetical protein [Moorella sp. Hama-1]MDN5361165.1 hypothetical protein [Moorella sp. (in: firmicutes)]BCV20867.1 hypothetical protein hamaS1_09360 [Moorella sp. Hama-1]